MSETVTVKLKILSPLHIGSGEEASPLDYYIDGNSFCRLNMDSLFADSGFTREMQDKFIQAAKTQRYIGTQLPRDLLLRHVAYRLPISGKARQLLAGNSEAGKTVVNTFIKSAGRVYLPGSSVKGAILSALCWRILLDGWNSGKPAAKEDIQNLLTRGATRNRELLLDVVLSRLGGRGRGAFTHWLDVTDSGFSLPAECLEISLARVQDARGRGAILILYETLRPGAEFTLSLKLDSGSRQSPDSLLTTVNDFYQRVFKADEPQGRPPASSGLIRLGQGSGAYATSMLILAADTGLNRSQQGYRVKPPRTRKRIDDVFAMGWAQISMESRE